MCAVLVFLVVGQVQIVDDMDATGTNVTWQSQLLQPPSYLGYRRQAMLSGSGAIVHFAAAVDAEPKDVWLSTMTLLMTLIQADRLWTVNDGVTTYASGTWTTQAFGQIPYDAVTYWRGTYWARVAGNVRSSTGTLRLSLSASPAGTQNLGALDAVMFTPTGWQEDYMAEAVEALECYASLIAGVGWAMFGVLLFMVFLMAVSRRNVL